MIKSIAITLLVIACASCAQTVMREDNDTYLRAERRRCASMDMDAVQGINGPTNAYYSKCVQR